MAHFPEYPKLAADAKRQKIQVQHVLSMQMGTEWNENLPYTDPRNSEAAMECAADRYEYILGRPIVALPGKRWTYNGGAPAIIVRLIEKGSGQPINIYAKEKLFRPSGDQEIRLGQKQGRDAVCGVRSAPDDPRHGQNRSAHSQQRTMEGQAGCGGGLALAILAAPCQNEF